MKKITPEAKRRIGYIFFALGIILSAISWPLDQAKSIRAVLTVVAPDYVDTKDALGILDQDEQVILPVDPQVHKFSFTYGSRPSVLL